MVETENNKSLEGRIEKIRIDFDTIPDMGLFKQIAAEAYDERTDNYTIYLIRPKDRIGSFDVIEPFGNQGNQSALFLAKAYESRLLFKKGETCLIKGLANPSIMPVSESKEEEIINSLAESYRAFYNERRIMHFLRKQKRIKKENNLSLMLQCNSKPSQGKPYIALKKITTSEPRKRYPFPGIDPYIVLRIAQHITNGLTELEKYGICHGDVKPQNILFDEEQNSWLIDFGAACFYGKKNGGKYENDPEHAKLIATPMYCSPEFAKFKWQKFYAGYDAIKDKQTELITSAPKNDKYDAYSLGVTLWEFLTGEKRNTAEIISQKYRAEEITDAILQIKDIENIASKITKELHGSVPEDVLHYLSREVRKREGGMPEDFSLALIFKYISERKKSLSVDNMLSQLKRNPTYFAEDQHGVTEFLNNLIKGLTEYDPQKRLSPAQAYENITYFIQTNPGIEEEMREKEFKKGLTIKRFESKRDNGEINEEKLQVQRFSRTTEIIAKPQEEIIKNPEETDIPKIKKQNGYY